MTIGQTRPFCGEACLPNPVRKTADREQRYRSLSATAVRGRINIIIARPIYLMFPACPKSEKINRRSTPT
jgi:hypothetical protein